MKFYVLHLKNVIRGLHFQEQPHEISKFVTCVKGKILMYL